MVSWYLLQRNRPIIVKLYAIVNTLLLKSMAEVHDSGGGWGCRAGKRI